DLAIIVGKSSNLVKDLFNDKTTEGLARYENVQELLNSIKEFVDDQQNRAMIDDEGVVIEEGDTEEAMHNRSSLGAYLQQITLLTDADDDKGESDVVKLMTIHAAKGL